jgi:hypothetical protein
MGIEEMFRDYKSGGYYLEGTGLKGQRLLALILVNSTGASEFGKYIKWKVDH